jgi:hypothetical protein
VAERRLRRTKAVEATLANACQKAHLNGMMNRTAMDLERNVCGSRRLGVEGQGYERDDIQ